MGNFKNVCTVHLEKVGDTREWHYKYINTVGARRNNRC